MLSHPRCEDLGVQHVGSVESIPTECTTVHMEDRASETEFRRILTDMNSNATCVVLSEGIDVDGTVHEGEVVTFRRLGDAQPDGVTVHPLLYHFRRWLRMTHSSLPPRALHSPSHSSPSSEPSWLTEAEVRVETEVIVVDDGCHEDTNAPDPTPLEPLVPSPWGESTASLNVPVLLSDIPEHHVASPPRTSTHATGFVLHGATALTLDGVVTPAILTSLAQSNSIVYLPTTDGIRTSLTRVRNAIWIGAYTVDLATWNVTECTYKIASRSGRTYIAPLRTVGQMHHLKRRQFERR